MIKNVLCLAVLLTAFTATAQTPQVGYLEVTANYVSGSGNTTERAVTYIVAVDNYQSSDSLILTLIDAEKQPIYTTGNTLANWQSGYPNRMEGNTLYLTIDIGNHTGIEQFEAKAHTSSGGTAIPGKTFKKEL